MKAVLFIVTSASLIGTRERPTGYEFSEVAHPYAALRERGIGIHFASPLGGIVPEDGYDHTDSISKSFREGDGFIALNQSVRIADVDVSRYGAVFFPGGLGPMVDLAHDPKTKELIQKAVAQDKIVAAVCHGPVALLDVRLSNGSKLLKGRRVTSFTRSEEVGHSLDDIPFLLDDALRSEGAVHASVAPFLPHVEIDGKLITGQNPASARAVGQAIADAMDGLAH